MNMKAIMFAGTGLFVSMVATTMWISHDMAEIRERERQQQVAECAAATQGQQPGVVGAQDTTVPGVATADGMAPAGTTAPPDAACTTEPASGAADPALVDPATGQPYDQMAGGSVPADAAMADPYATAQPITSDPAIAPVTSDPSFDASGQSLDPSTVEGANPIGF